MIKFTSKVLIVGASGFGKEVLTCLIDCAASTGWRIRDICSFMETDEFYENTKSIHGIPVITHDQFDPEEYDVLVAIGNSKARRRVVEKLPSETKFATIIHPSAVISEWVKIGNGSIITAGTIITTDIEIGRHAQLNLHTTIGHDCVIGDFFTTAPGAKISGDCKIGDDVYFGTNASIRQGLNVCDNVTIGMGSVVVKNIVEEGVYVGSPAKKLRSGVQ